jgi:hypothetical protein
MSARRTPSPPSMTILWAMTGIVIGVLLLAVAMNNLTLTYAALALTAAYAIFGMAYGLWAARCGPAPSRRGHWLSGGSELI